MTRCQALDKDRKRQWFEIGQTSKDGIKLVTPDGRVFLMIRSQVMGAIGLPAPTGNIMVELRSKILDLVREEHIEINTPAGQIMLTQAIINIITPYITKKEEPAPECNHPDKFSTEGNDFCPDCRCLVSHVQ